MINYIFLNKNDRVKIIHHINDEDNLLIHETGDYFIAKEDMFMLVEYFDNYSTTIKHVRQTRIAKENDVISNENNEELCKRINFKELRKTLNSLNFKTVYVWGGYSPITLNKEIEIPDFSMSGTRYFILDLSNHEHCELIENNIKSKEQKINTKKIIEETEEKARNTDEYLLFSKKISSMIHEEIKNLSKLPLFEKWWNKVKKINGFGVGTGPTTVSMGWQGMGVFLGHTGSHNENVSFCSSYEEAQQEFDRTERDYVEYAKSRGYMGCYGGSYISETNTEFLRVSFLSATKTEQKEVIEFILKNDLLIIMFEEFLKNNQFPAEEIEEKRKIIDNMNSSSRAHIIEVGFKKIKGRICW